LEIEVTGMQALKHFPDAIIWKFKRAAYVNHINARMIHAVIPDDGLNAVKE
jgi:hypothetical protein